MLHKVSLGPKSKTLRGSRLDQEMLSSKRITLMSSSPGLSS